MTQPSLKRLIMILGGKGGTGKTLFCRLLFYFLVTANGKILGFDADIENPEFDEYHAKSSHPVKLLNFLDAAQAKEFFTVVNAEKPDVVLMDMPGASGSATRHQMEMFGIFRIAEMLGYRLTISTVLSNTYSPISSFETMLDFCGDRADYVVVRSQLWNQGSLSFDRWEKSEARQKFMALNGLDIEMPILEASTFDALHEKALSFLDYQQLPFGDQLLIGSFLDRGKVEIEKAARYLGLPTPAAVGAAKSSKSKSPASQAKTTVTHE